MSPAERAIIESALARLVDRLRSASQARLTRPHDQLAGQSLDEAAYELAVWCVERSSEVGPIELPALPRLGPLAAGDQLWVVGRDLLNLLDSGECASPIAAEFLDRVNQIRRVS